MTLRDSVTTSPRRPSRRGTRRRRGFSYRKALKLLRPEMLASYDREPREPGLFDGVPRHMAPIQPKTRAVTTAHGATAMERIHRESTASFPANFRVATRDKVPAIRELLEAKRRMGLVAEVSNHEANNPVATAARLLRLRKNPRALGQLQDLCWEREALRLELQYRYGDKWRYRETTKAPRSNRHKGWKP